MNAAFTDTGTLRYREQLKRPIPPPLDKWQPVVGVRATVWGFKRNPASNKVACFPVLIGACSGSSTWARTRDLRINSRSHPVQWAP